MATKRKTKSAELREFKETSRHRLPPISHAFRVGTERTLKKIGEQLADTIEAHKSAHLLNPTDHSKAQLAYFKTCAACIRWLRSLNQQRRGLGSTK